MFACRHSRADSTDYSQEGSEGRRDLLHSVRSFVVLPGGDDVQHSQDRPALHVPTPVHVGGLLSDSQGLVEVRQHTWTLRDRQYTHPDQHSLHQL